MIRQITISGFVILGMLVGFKALAQSYSHLGMVDAEKVREAAAKAVPMVVLPVIVESLNT